MAQNAYYPPKNLSHFADNLQNLHFITNFLKKDKFSIDMNSEKNYS